MKPRKPLPGRAKPIGRSGKRIKARKADPSKRRFADRRDEAYAMWIRTLPCILAGNIRSFGCDGPVEACHVKTRSTGGDDRENLWPGCHRHHLTQHLWGIKTFQEFFKVNLGARAKALDSQYRKAA